MDEEDYDEDESRLYAIKKRKVEVLRYKTKTLFRRIQLYSNRNFYITHTTATHPRPVQQVSQCEKSTQEHKRKKGPFLTS